MTVLNVVFLGFMPQMSGCSSIMISTITLRIQVLSLVEIHDQLEDRRTELRHTKPYPIRMMFVKFRFFQISKCLGGIKSKFLFFRVFSFYYVKQIDMILPLSLFCYSHIMTSYCVSITEQTTAK